MMQKNANSEVSSAERSAPEVLRRNIIPRRGHGRKRVFSSLSQWFTIRVAQSKVSEPSESGLGRKLRCNVHHHKLVFTGLGPNNSSYNEFLSRGNHIWQIEGQAGTCFPRFSPLCIRLTTSGSEGSHVYNCCIIRGLRLHVYSWM